MKRNWKKCQNSKNSETSASRLNCREARMLTKWRQVLVENSRFPVHCLLVKTFLSLETDCTRFLLTYLLVGSVFVFSWSCVVTGQLLPVFVARWPSCSNSSANHTDVTAERTRWMRCSSLRYQSIWLAAAWSWRLGKSLMSFLCCILPMYREIIHCTIYWTRQRLSSVHCALTVE